MTPTEKAGERIRAEAVTIGAYPAGRFWCAVVTAQADEDVVLYQTAPVFISADLARGCAQFVVDAVRRAA